MNVSCLREGASAGVSGFAGFLIESFGVAFVASFVLVIEEVSEAEASGCEVLIASAAVESAGFAEIFGGTESALVECGEVGAGDKVFHGAGFLVEGTGFCEVGTTAARLLKHHGEVVAACGISEVTGVLKIGACIGGVAFFVE